MQGCPAFRFRTVYFAHKYVQTSIKYGITTYMSYLIYTEGK